MWTYDKLRELAIQAVTTPSASAGDAVEVLTDALIDSGVMQPFSSGWEELGPERQRKRLRNLTLEWVFRWAMKAVYGAHNVQTSTWAPFDDQPWGPGFKIAPSREPSTEHRRWSTKRIEARNKGLAWEYAKDRPRVSMG